MQRNSFDEKLERILRTSAAVFGEKGFHRASIRDIARATDISLSGLYHYFGSKDELLFLIQSHCLDIILDRLHRDLEGIGDPEERLRVLVRNHLRFFVSNMAEMKVLSHEANSLGGEYLREVRARKKEYTGVAYGILERLAPEAAWDLRVSTFSLFGMMNWIYNWYREDRDVDVERLADEMLHLFLEGYRTPPLRGSGGGDAPERDSSLWTSG